jgi:rare lipoprotein A
MRSLFAAVLAALTLAGGASWAEAGTGSRLHTAEAYEGGNWQRPRYAKQRHTGSVKRAGRHAAVRTVAGGSHITGMASYYGGRFHGRRTASGARFDSSGLTAAHRSLPFGTRVRVTHMGNGRSVEVRINDRGPFVGGRIIDLSSGAAGVIGMHGQGVARVRVSVIGR